MLSMMGGGIGATIAPPPLPANPDNPPPPPPPEKGGMDSIAPAVNPVVSNQLIQQAAIQQAALQQQNQQPPLSGIQSLQQSSHFNAAQSIPSNIHKESQQQGSGDQQSNPFARNQQNPQNSSYDRYNDFRGNDNRSRFQDDNRGNFQDDNRNNWNNRAWSQNNRSPNDFGNRNNSNSDVGRRDVVPRTDQLSPEEVQFEESYRKWDENFEEWKRDNANQRGRRYDDFVTQMEDIRSKLLEKREQLLQKRLKQNQPFGQPMQDDNKGHQFNDHDDRVSVDDNKKQYSDAARFEANQQPMAQTTFSNENPFISSSGDGNSGIPGLDLIPESAAKAEVAQKVNETTDTPTTPLPANVSAILGNPIITSEIRNILSSLQQTPPEAAKTAVPPKRVSRFDSPRENVGQANQPFANQQQPQQQQNQYLQPQRERQAYRAQGQAQPPSRDPVFAGDQDLRLMQQPFVPQGGQDKQQQEQQQQQQPFIPQSDQRPQQQPHSSQDNRRQHSQERSQQPDQYSQERIQPQNVTANFSRKRDWTGGPPQGNPFQRNAPNQRSHSNSSQSHPFKSNENVNYDDNSSSSSSRVQNDDEEFRPVHVIDYQNRSKNEKNTQNALPRQILQQKIANHKIEADEHFPRKVYDYDHESSTTKFDWLIPVHCYDYNHQKKKVSMHEHPAPKPLPPVIPEEPELVRNPRLAHRPPWPPRHDGRYNPPPPHHYPPHASGPPPPPHHSRYEAPHHYPPHEPGPSDYPPSYPPRGERPPPNSSYYQPRGESVPTNYYKTLHERGSWVRHKLFPAPPANVQSSHIR